MSTQTNDAGDGAAGGGGTGGGGRVRRSALSRRLMWAVLHLGHKGLNTLLLAVLATQFFLWWGVCNDSQYALPEWTADIIRDRLEREGIACRFSEINVRPTGCVEVRNLRVGQPGVASHNAAIGRAIVVFSVPELLTGRFKPRRALIEGASVYCPAPASPDGRRHRALRDVRAVLARDEYGWVSVETLQGRYGEMPIVLHGEFLPSKLTLPKRDPARRGEPLMTPADWAALNKITAWTHSMRGRLEKLGKASLEVDGHGEENGAVEFKVLAEGALFNLPLPGTARARDARLTWTIRFDGHSFHPGGDSVLTVGGLEWSAPPVMLAKSANAATGDAKSAAAALPPRFTLRTGPLRLVSRFGPNWELPSRVRLAGSDIASSAGLRLDYALGWVDWENFPRVAAGLSVVSAADTASVRVVGDWETQASDVSFKAAFSPSRILAHPAVRPRLTGKLATLEIPQTVRVEGAARLGPARTFLGANLRFESGAARFLDFRVNTARGRMAVLSDGSGGVSGFRLEEADFRGDGGTGAAGSVSVDFGAGNDFRFLLSGSTDGHYLDPIIGREWTDTWAKISLDPAQLPRADIEIRGRWAVPQEFIYCFAAGANIGWSGTRFDHAELRIVEFPELIALFDMHVERDGNTAGGTLRVPFRREGRTRTTDSVRFQFDGALPKEHAEPLGGTEVVKMLAPVAVPAGVPLPLSVTGRVHLAGSATPGRVQVRVGAKVPGKFSAWGMEFANFDGSVAYDDKRLVVTIDSADFAGGKITMSTNSPWAAARLGRPERVWVDLTGAPARLVLDLEMLGARRGLFLDNIGRLGKATAPAAAAGTAGGTAAAAPTAPTEKKAAAVAPPAAPPAAEDRSSLDVAFLGACELPNIGTSLDGAGVARLSDPALHKLEIFGGLSRFLNKVGVDFGVYNLTHATTSFTLREGVMRLPDLKITGSSSEINVRGNYTFEGSKLNFRALLTPRSGESIPVIGVVTSITNKWAHLFPVDISGTLQKPVWTVEPTVFGDPLRRKN
ncbi:MAG: AsmA-like C-terminal region-containing protein [Puniceicoccales bacterium]|jgi:hypothetical protein|nr:AsmA-like C-terminal region-containing protein [Puniceicoccales bacterium]